MRVGEEFTRRQIGQHPALGERDNARGIFRYQVHVVLNQQHRADARVARALHQRVHHAALVGGGDAAGGLVEQDDMRIQHEGAHDVEQILLALREMRGQPVEAPAQVEDASHALHLLAHRLHVVHPAPEIVAAALARDNRRGDRLEHRELGEHVHELEGPRHAQPCQLHRPPRRRSTRP
ncbi:MAG: hypothetical protein MO853_01315 [Candidatus Protistobacter heckmanni]|nr:hypothetical protein [Candidatus Protistobacter heckmanni]